MERRNCCQIINEMLLKVPLENEDFIKDLEWNLEDASFKAPEENIQWERTMDTLMKNIKIPKEEWEFEILNIFTTKPIIELKSYYD